MSDNWIITNLENALSTWNDKLSEVWLLITETPQNFKGGAIWTTIVDINGALQAIGYGLLVLFFAMGIIHSLVLLFGMNRSPSFEVLLPNRRLFQFLLPKRR